MILTYSFSFSLFSFFFLIFSRSSPRRGQSSLVQPAFPPLREVLRGHAYPPTDSSAARATVFRRGNHPGCRHSVSGKLFLFSFLFLFRPPSHYRVFLSFSFFFLFLLSFSFSAANLDFLRMDCLLGVGTDSLLVGLVAVGWPHSTEPDVLFSDLSAMRSSEAFKEWASILFDRWASRAAAPLRRDVDICSRAVLQEFMFVVPGVECPGLNDVDRFWLAAWWRRLYGSLVPFDILFRFLRGFTDHNSRPLLALGSRLGPGVFGYLDPADFCWKHHLTTSVVGIHTANCICDGLY